jgi:hypothetical protein
MGGQQRRPRLESVYFDGPDSKYSRMARVLEHTAQRYCRGWAINVKTIAPEPVKSAINHAGCEANSQKLDEWCRTIMEAPIGDRILLIDADTFFTNPIDDIWDYDFDIAYTIRTYDLPINGGVVFVRVTPETKEFVDVWRYKNNRMLADAEFHRQWKRLYGGINQASFGYLINSIEHRLNLLTLRCAEWNCEDSCWDTFDPGFTRIVHVKSGLRRWVFPPAPGDRSRHFLHPESVLRPLADRWYALEQEVLEQDVAHATVPDEIGNLAQ